MPWDNNNDGPWNNNNNNPWGNNGNNNWKEKKVEMIWIKF